MKQKKHEERIAVRLSFKQRQEIENVVKDGKYKSISEVIRSALENFLHLNDNGGNKSASK